MPTVSRARTVGAAPGSVWEVLSDPHHLPRWWPRVERVEDATPEAWTTVMRSSRGRAERVARAQAQEIGVVAPRAAADPAQAVELHVLVPECGLKPLQSTAW